MICLGSVVFFFKQKTAYEMRISDWSSDVCSSDLTAKATFTVGAEGVVLESIEVQADKASLGTLVGLEQLDIAWDATGGRWTVDAAQQGDGSGGDRKRVVEGKSVSVRVDLGGRRIFKKKKYDQNRRY